MGTAVQHFPLPLSGATSAKIRVQARSVVQPVEVGADDAPSPIAGMGSEGTVEIRARYLPNFYSYLAMEQRLRNREENTTRLVSCVVPPVTVDNCWDRFCRHLHPICTDRQNAHHIAINLPILCQDVCSTVFTFRVPAVL